MDKAILDKQPNGTIKLTITIPQEEIEKTRRVVLEEYSKKANISGFRPGKAPKSMVEESIDKEKLTEEVLKKMLPQAYSKAIQSNNLKPIVNPKIHIEGAEPEKDWEFTALTCEAPDVDLGNYKQNIQNLTAKSKIIIPGKPETDNKKPTSQEVMQVIIESTKTKIPNILIEQEADRLLSQLLDDIKKLGLTLDQYLSSTNRNPQSLRQEYEKRAEDDMRLEFALHKIAETENITVEPVEIDEAIKKAANDTERARLENNRYLLAAILRQQKTLDFLLKL